MKQKTNNTSAPSGAKFSAHDTAGDPSSQRGQRESNNAVPSTAKNHRNPAAKSIRGKAAGGIAGKE